MMSSRTPLQAGWAMCSTTPGAQAPAAGSSSWLEIESLAPVAAALRSRGQWSLDEPARSFDAQDWWYRVEFDAPADGEQGAWLHFEGLATCAHVWLNGEQILCSTNMFVAHDCDVARLMRPRANELLIRFSALDELLQVRKPRARWRVPMVAHQQLRWWRTTLLGRTPGWSPPCAVVGPWKDVWLSHGPQAKRPQLNTQVNGRTGLVHCSFPADGGQDSYSAVDAPAIVQLQLHRNGRVAVQDLQWNEAAKAFEGTLALEDPDLWWPHTHGDPALYEANVLVRRKATAAHPAPQEFPVPAGTVGFRTIAIDTSGGDFSVSVNSVAVFCRGAVWTPLDPVTLRSSAQECTAAVLQACDAGMNMLRVPGTGVYEEDHFYDACDRAGVLVWQDFMFANMDYPADDESFRASVVLEARQQLARLRPHPCLAVLCGNSEAAQQAAMGGASHELWRMPLFDDLLPAICREVAGGIAYWPSSAHGGAFPHQASEGTTSYFGVGAYRRPLDDAGRSALRFATECLAFANIPSDATLARLPGGLAVRVHHPVWKARSPRDLGAGWDFDDVRDHYVQTLCNEDPARLRASDHDRYLALGGMAAGEAMASSFAQWRRPGASCRGAMVLMLRDLWAGAGWGLLDDAGTPKAPWYYLKRSMQPVVVLLADEGVNGLFIHAINETSRPVALTLQFDAWQGGEVQVARASRPIALEARGAISVSATELLGYFEDLGYVYRFGPMPCDVIVASLVDEGGHTVAQAFHFPGGLLARMQGDVGLTASAERVDGQDVWLHVTTRRFASCVQIAMPGYEPDDNFFHLAPGGSRRIRMRRRDLRAGAGFVQAVNSTKAALIEAGP
ncbi:MAG: glycoside hydrolase family 2 protein [Pseudomonadota bacterium]